MEGGVLFACVVETDKFTAIATAMEDDEQHRCWQCKGELVPHPLRRKARHPVPWCSSECTRCKEAVIECSDCAATWPDAWYDIGDIDEWWHYSAGQGYSLCGDCYVEAVRRREIACDECGCFECDCADAVLCHVCGKRCCGNCAGGQTTCELCKRVRCAGDPVCARLAKDSDCWMCRL